VGDLETSTWPGVSARRLLAETRAADVLHLYSFNTGVFDAALLLGARYGKPIVLSDLGGGTRAPGRLLGRSRLRYVDGMAAISEWSAFVDMKWPRDRPYRIVYGGGDHMILPGSSANQPPSPASDFLYVGRILPHKGLHICLAALPREAKLTVAGSSKSSDLNYMRSIESLAVGKSVRFVLNPSDAELRQLCESTRFTLLPSVHSYEGKHFNRPELLGLVLLESLFVGTPCAGSAVGGSGELLDRLGMPTATPGDVNGWRTMLEGLMALSADSYQLLKTAVNASRPFYTWGRVARDCLDLYREVIYPA
jgi:glycosyltransferase involved in cell wall biosynthesis